MVNFYSILFYSILVLKFHRQHDKAAGLQNDKIQAGRESIRPLLLKIATYTCHISHCEIFLTDFSPSESQFPEEFSNLTEFPDKL